MSRIELQFEREKMKPLVQELRFKAEEVNGVALDLLLTTAAQVIEGQCAMLDTAFNTIDRYGREIDVMQQILQKIWDQDGFVDEDLKGAIRLMVRENP
jgi:uncharacterized membrane protein